MKIDKFLHKRGYNETRKSVIWNLEGKRRMGNVLWAIAPSGQLLPVDLFNVLTPSDAALVERFGQLLIENRGVKGILGHVASFQYEFPELVAPYLAKSIETRAEAYVMKADGSWEEYWTTYETPVL